MNAKVIQAQVAARRQSAAELPPVRNQSLFLMKERALQHAQSFVPQPSQVERSSFGFVPKDAEIEVLNWPKL